MSRPTSAHRRRRILISAVGAVTTAAGAMLAAPTTAGAATLAFHHYVALGDSYAAVGDQSKLASDPTASGCQRSITNYAHDIAAALAPATFADVTCGGATTVDMTAAQTITGGSNPPQSDALTADTDLVTVTIGGNDLGFVDVVTQCGELGVLNPGGNPCQQYYTSGGTDQLAARITALAPKIDAVLQGIHQRSPNATVVVGSYLPILPANWGCWPAVPIAYGDVSYMHGVGAKLDTMLATEAAANGALAVDLGNVSGHSACEGWWSRWVEPTVGNDANTVLLHPNTAGQAAVAQAIEAKLNG